MGAVACQSANHGFLTNLKYASVLQCGKLNGSDIREDQLSSLEPIRSFHGDYPRIKELCRLYSGPEAAGVSDLYRRFSYALNRTDEDVMVLDIESSFDAAARDNEDARQDRIDLVLFSRSRQTLLFVEAKTLANPAIIATEGTTPPVVTQVNRYREQLSLQRKSIISAYEQYVSDINNLLGMTLPKPKHVVSDVPLLMFGFDSDQKKSRLPRIRNVLGMQGVTCMEIGDPNRASANTLVEWFSRARNIEPI